jgi:hypothetical protein
MSSFSFAQQLTKEQAAQAIALCKEVEGTYKLIQTDPRIEVAVGSDACEMVKKNRKASETVYLKYNDYITLEIFSEEQLKKQSHSIK